MMEPWNDTLFALHGLPLTPVMAAAYLLYNGRMIRSVLEGHGEHIVVIVSAYSPFQLT